MEVYTGERGTIGIVSKEESFMRKATPKQCSSSQFDNQNSRKLEVFAKRLEGSYCYCIVLLF